MADRTGFEPVISTVTVWHVNLYTNGPYLAGHTGIEPVTFSVTGNYSTAELIPQFGGS